MKIVLKALRDQVVVLTGATSGIGLATARMAGVKGARLVLAARSCDALDKLVKEILDGGGSAVSVIADVSKEEDSAAIAAKAIQAYGGIDTWINNAGTGLYGRVDTVPVEDMRKLFEVNFWGVVYGSREAIKHLSAAGGAIINLGSEVSERAVPLQGIYSASKHAIKGFTEALRMELEEEPDIYQGTEFWDRSLVDPDNRRPVDYAIMRRARPSLRKPLRSALPAAMMASRS